MSNIPQRKCIGCGEMKDKRELLRVVKPKEGEIFIDPIGKANGRGAYICKTGDCFEKTKKQRRLEKSFKCSISSDVYSMIEENLQKT